MIQYSQRDPRWKFDELGYGGARMTIENYGCLLTDSATVLSNFGIQINPQELNEKLKANGGFDGALMYFGVLSSLFPVKTDLISCGKDMPAPMDKIDSMIEQGLYPIVHIDSNPRVGLQDHWVILYGKEGNKYLMSDPWTIEPEKERVTLDRYIFGGRARDAILDVFIIEPFSLPQQPPVSQDPVTVVPVPAGKKVRVLQGGLRLRNVPSTSTPELAMLAADTQLVSAGDPIPDGDITWQPVIVYAAVNYKNERYLEAVE